MGRATRWLKRLFRIKNTNPDRSSDDDPQRRSITGLCYNEIESLRASLSDVAEDARRTRPCYYCSPEKQNKNSMAVAAATSAAADAALAAARAAVAVVRLTGHGRSAFIGRTRFDQNAAAVMIQTFFRGYLARRALKALKGLVKLQAIVRGHLVRKQAMLTLKSMQALIRLQTATRYRRSHGAATKNPVHHQARPYISMEKIGGGLTTRRQSASSIPSRTTTDESINGSRRNSPSHRRSSVNSLLDFTNSPNCYHSPTHYSGGYISTPSRNFNFLQEIHYEEFRRCSSAQITPRFTNTTQSDDVNFRQHGGFVFPSYMSNTQSFNAKARSSSAPKQRISRVSLHEVLELSRSSFSGVRMQRS